MNENLQAILGGLLILVGFVTALTYPRPQYSALRQLRVLWWVLSLVPLIVLAGVAVVTARALAEGANLWPILLIFMAPVATAYLLLLRFVERRIGRGANVETISHCAAVWPQCGATVNGR